MSEFESYSQELLMASKLFLIDAGRENISRVDKQRFLRAALTQAFFFLEAEINYLSSHFKHSNFFDLSEKSLLAEKEIQINKGVFSLSARDKFFRMEDKIEFFLARFSTSAEAAKGTWFSALKDAINLRNRLVHPKQAHQIRTSDVEACILAILGCLSALYSAIFQKDFHLAKLGLHPGPAVGQT